MGKKKKTTKKRSCKKERKGGPRKKRVATPRDANNTNERRKEGVRHGKGFFVIRFHKKKKGGPWDKRQKKILCFRKKFAEKGGGCLQEKIKQISKKGGSAKGKQLLKRVHDGGKV